MTLQFFFKQLIAAIAIMQKLKKFFLQINTRIIYLYSFVTGIISGGVAVLLYKSLHLLTTFTHETLAHVPVMEPGDSPLSAGMASDPHRLFYFLLPIAGGLLTGLCIHYFGTEASGGGTETFLDAFHNKAGILRKRTGIIKFLATLFTLGSGGSGGKEGPMTLIGASVGSILGKFVKMGARAQRTLLLAGAAGGLGAIFRTPLGGAITAVEVLYKEDFESDALIPCIISSVTAYTVFGSVVGYKHVLNFSSSMFNTPSQLIFYAVLALFCTLCAFVFIKIYQGIGDHFFNKIPLPKKYLPVVGGLLIACVGLFVPEVLGGGLGVIQQAIYGSYSANWIIACKLFLLFAVLKMFTTSFTVQSGGSAGTLVPSFFIGGMLGGFVGTIFNHYFPAMVPSITPFIIVGMASFFSAVTNASLGALVMVTEFTGGYELLPPLMLVCVISLILSHRWSIYKNQVNNKFLSKAHLWDMNPIILKTTKIVGAFQHFDAKGIVLHNALLRDIKNKARLIHESDLVVRDDKECLVGVLSLKDLEFEEEEDITGLHDILVAKDMIRGELFYITPNDTLLKAMRLLSHADFDKLPVINNENEKKLLGYLTRKDILRYYNSLGSA